MKANKVLYVMFSQDDNGENEYWFDEDKNLIDGYSCNDASWRSEYFNPIFELCGIEIRDLPYDKKLAKRAGKALWGL